MPINGHEVASVSMEDTKRLLTRAQQGDRAAQEQLVQNNLALVHSVARRFRDRGLEYEDIFQIGCVGLVKAIQRFDPSFSVQFSTYAVPMIMGEIRRTLRDDGAVKVPRSVKEKAIEIMREQERMRLKLQRTPTIAELAQQCGVQPEEISFYLESFTQPLSIDQPFSDGDDRSGSPLDRLEDTKTGEAAAVEHVMISQAIAQLPPRERKIIYLRYYQDKTQNEIARIMGISQVQISRLESRILKKMRTAMD